MRSRNGVLSYTESEYRGISLPVLDTYLSQFFSLFQGRCLLLISVSPSQFNIISTW